MLSLTHGARALTELLSLLVEDPALAPVLMRLEALEAALTSLGSFVLILELHAHHLPL